MSFSVFGFAVPAWIFALVCAAWFSWELGRLWLAMTSDLWPHIEGMVHEARIENRPDSDGDDFFVPIVRYTYKVAGETYQGKRLAFHPKGSYKYDDIVKALTGVVAGKAHRVRFHPRYPRLCVLKAGATWWNYLLLLILFVMGVVAMVAQGSGEA